MIVITIKLKKNYEFQKKAWKIAVTIFLVN